MNAQEENAALLRVLELNSHVGTAWLDDATNPPTLNLLVDVQPVDGVLAVKNAGHIIPLAIPAWLRELPFTVRQCPPFKDLRAYDQGDVADNQHQECQDEPVWLGTQLQPAGAPWVGTAGLPVKWQNANGHPHWGILSNWHVMCGGRTAKGHPQHQPTDQHSALGYLADWCEVTGPAVNYLDAAIADAWLDRFHTISSGILGIGAPNDAIADAGVGLQVIKSGRTTAVTSAECHAIGAAVKVSYGAFTATFADQDVFKDVDGHFSAPGDSGSAILSADCLCPTSLLFAGGGDLTIGNPIRYAVERFNLLFPFN